MTPSGYGGQIAPVNQSGPLENVSGQQVVLPQAKVAIEADAGAHYQALPQSVSAHGNGRIAPATRSPTYEVLLIIGQKAQGPKSIDEKRFSAYSMRHRAVSRSPRSR